MNDKEENLRNFNARIFIKGKCYNFDNVQKHKKPINDKKITSSLWRFFQLINNLFNFIQPFSLFSNKVNKKILIKWLAALFLLILLMMVIFGVFFKFTNRII
jgi:hypothetical protein